MLTVNDAATCGNVAFPAENTYTFDATAGQTYTVTFTTTAGDPDVCLTAPSTTLLGCSLTIPPPWVDQDSFVAAENGNYRLDVFIFSSDISASTYAIQVTSP